jgi:hypothetical protein
MVSNRQMTIRKILCAAALSLIGSLTPGQAAAFCSEPIAPSCASNIDRSDRYGSRAECREKVQGYVEKLRAYKSCLTNLVKQTDAEIQRFESLLSDAAPTG